MHIVLLKFTLLTIYPLLTYITQPSPYFLIALLTNISQLSTHPLHIFSLLTHMPHLFPLPPYSHTYFKSPFLLTPPLFSNTPSIPTHSLYLFLPSFPTSLLTHLTLQSPLIFIFLSYLFTLPLHISILHTHSSLTPIPILLPQPSTHCLLTYHTFSPNLFIL